MSAPSAIMFVVLLIAALLPFGLIFQYSNWQHSRYRNRLWNIRDLLVDELLSGNVEFSRGAQVLLHIIETHIRNTRRHTFTDVMVAVFLLRNVELPPITDLMLDDAVRPGDRKVLMKYFIEFREANFSYLKRSSPSGWLIGLRLRLNASRRQPNRDREQPTPALRQQVESVELRAIPELAPPAQKIRRGPLIDDSMSLA
ncbi:hypothetical protein AB0N38_22955 [Micromonospora aurantiaca]|uniref:hypothetical protein n=1 Tax=Micromonospora aurantiaca (nom. illeg.) TaxID=47850 RepID=UPI003434F920